MANILQITDLVPTINMGSGGNHLAITIPMDTILLGPGSSLAIADLLATVSITARGSDSGISWTDPQSTLSLTAHSNRIASIALTDIVEVVSMQARSSRTGSISMTEPLALLSLTGAAGRVGSIAIIDTIPTLALIIKNPTHAGIAITDLVEEAFLVARGIPAHYFRKAVVMHTSSHAVCEYVNFDFNSLVQFNGEFVGFNENGAYLIGGDTDLGEFIQAELTRTVDIGDTAVRVPVESFISGRFGTGEMEIRVKQDEASEFVYPYIKFPGQREARAVFGKGLKGRLYMFSVKNVGGSAFDLHSFKILGNVIVRKTR